ncbi:phosphatidylinositol-glycan biosynthesis class X -like [Olea europaea subsp. europaea]|uniref:Phosphatidylinositol-glycan biosynthesis class X -like n=1 Tax=Olea europaea subsp. europaea TaxID=158383 RepID=A0A8S0PKP8_OLEEU|nr:phosphatidylinositol-glycan biosynthesis class X -like [Olea europaea subsp. europaea]
MLSFGYRANAFLPFTVTILVLMCAMSSLSDNFNWPSPTTDVQPLGYGFSKVKFGPPDLFLRCSSEGKSFNRNCLFMLTDDSVNYESNPVVWEVPCGIKEHAGVVFAVTFLIAIVTALLIVLTSIYH